MRSSIPFRKTDRQNVRFHQRARSTRPRCRLCLVVLTGLLFFAFRTVPAAAQSSPLTVTITSPSEGETFYASPETVFYSISISGKAVTPNSDPSKIVVRLDVYGGDKLYGTWTKPAGTDGTFSFSATVNPDGPPSNDLITFIHEGCPTCHFTSEINLPPGRVMFRVTAIGSGKQASVERRIVVDRSETVTVPIHVVDADRADQPVPNVAVSAATRLYMWRTRYGSATTDVDGWAHLQLEKLGQAPTHYVFRVKPTLIDGRLYTGAESREMALPPGPSQIEAITLHVRSQRGEIRGTLAGNRPIPIPVLVRAINPLNGAMYSARSAQGAFAFNDIPVAKYLVLADRGESAAQGFQSDTAVVDLTNPPSTQITTTLALHEIPSQAIQGSIRAAGGEIVPFAWAALGGSSTTARADFSTDEFAFYNPPVAARFIQAIAPGYWSQSIAFSANVPVAVTLAPRPDTRRLTWGTGVIEVPSETIAEITDHRIVLVNGWIWGNGSGTFEIQSGSTTITLESAKFAIEQNPRQKWLYVSDGNANVVSDVSSSPVLVGPGEMLAFDEAGRQPVPLDTTVIRELARDVAPPDYVSEPSFQARSRDALAGAGISVAQLITFVTYCLVLLALIVAPAWLWNTLRRN